MRRDPGCHGRSPVGAGLVPAQGATPNDLGQAQAPPRRPRTASRPSEDPCTVEPFARSPPPVAGLEPGAPGLRSPPPVAGQPPAPVAGQTQAPTQASPADERARAIAERERARELFLAREREKRALFAEAGQGVHIYGGSLGL